MFEQAAEHGNDVPPGDGPRLMLQHADEAFFRRWLVFVIQGAVADRNGMGMVTGAGTQGIRHIRTWKRSDGLVEIRSDFRNRRIRFRMKCQEWDIMPPAVEQSCQKSASGIGENVGGLLLGGRSEDAVVIQSDPRATPGKPLLEPVFDPTIFDDIHQQMQIRLMVSTREDVADAGERGVRGFVQNQTPAVIGRAQCEIGGIDGDGAGRPVERPVAIRLADFQHHFRV